MFLALSADEQAGQVESEEVVAPVEEVAESESPLQDPNEEVAVEDDASYFDADAEDTEEPAETPEATALDESLTKTWKDMGYPEEMLKDFQNDDELRRSLATQDALALAPIRQKRAQAATPPATSGQPTPTPTEEKPAETAASKRFEKFKLDIDTSEWDEDAVKVISGLNDHYAAMLDKLDQELQQRDERYSTLEQTFQQQQSRLQQEQFAQEERAIESWFGSLNPEYADTFGQGALTALAPDSEAVKARLELVADADALAELDAKMGRPVQDWNARLTRALLSRFPDKTKEITRKEIAQQVQQRRKQNIARPSSRNGKALTGTDKAIERNRNYWKSRGVDVPRADRDEASESLL
jgi:hypothetical protein